MNKAKFRNILFMALLYAVTIIAIVPVFLLVPERKIEAYIVAVCLVFLAVVLTVYGKKCKCQSCLSLFGMKIISKAECDRRVITWTEKKNIKGLATNSYEETVHGELIDYDVCAQCRFCGEQKRTRQTVRKRS